MTPFHRWGRVFCVRNFDTKAYDSQGTQDMLMLLEADESYVSNLASASIIGLTKPVHATSYEAW
ncbi:hypothetical protein CJF30_00007454 [Rutstroemia sp. NJR-2017a BBW]|nr:hypothetical protein CJF30_00007454 [Rutstroemia sp. NJR-2017a BBW]